MTVSITHAKVSGRSAGTDPQRVYGTHWDADHVVPVASQAQAEAGTSEDVLLTPASATALVGAKAVRYDASQSLSDVEKLQARTNISALGADTIIFYKPQMYVAAAGGGVADDTAAFEAMRSGGVTPIYIPAGTYLIDPIAWDYPVYIIVDPGATIKQRTTGVVGPAYAAPTYTVTRQALFEFNDAGCAGSYVTGGGWFDGDRDNVTGFLDEYRSKWGAIDATAANVRIESLNARNFNTFAFSLENDYGVARDLYIEDCGQGFYAGVYKAVGDTKADGVRGQTIFGIKVVRPDNDGKSVFQHAIDIMYSHGSTVGSLSVVDQGGDVSGKSSTASGITIVNCQDSLVQGLAHDSWTTSLPRLSISCVGNINCVFSNMTARDFTSIGLEDISNSGCVFSNYVMDGGYLSSSSVGVNFTVGAQYAGGNRGRRRSILGSRSKHINGLAQRAGWGYFCRSERPIVDNCVSRGNLQNGIFVADWESNEASLGAIADVRPEPIILNGFIAYNNHGSGAKFDAFGKVIWTGGACYNNGQNTSNSQTDRSGVSLAPSEASDLFQIENVSCYDDQGETLTAAVTFNPVASDADNRITVTMLKPSKLDFGQYITIEDGAGSGSDITGYIHDYLYDDFVIQCSAPVTLDDFASTNLSGTWTTNGSDPTRLDGTSGAASSEVDGHLWITDGSGEYRQITAISGNNIVYINEAFTVALSADTLSAIRCSLTTIKSQKVGHRNSVTNLTSLFSKGCTAAGNIDADWVNSDPTKYIEGSEYTLETASTGVAIGAAAVVLVNPLPAGHGVYGVAAHVVTDISGGGVTSWSLVLETSAGTNLETYDTLLALTKNTKLNRAAVLSTRVDTTARRLTAEFAGGTPTAGAIRAKMRCRAARADAYADV